MKSCLSRAIGSMVLISCIYLSAMAQQGIGIGTDFPDPDASLEIRSTSTGILIPRLTTAQRNGNLAGLNGTDEGLLIYNLSDSEFNYWDGTRWLAFPGGDADWYENGTPPAAPDNIGDAIYTNGSVGIGIAVPAASFHIADVSGGLQTIRVQDLSQSGDAYNPSTATVSLANRATVFVDKVTGTMYSEDANRAYWRLDGNAGVVNAGYSGNCPNLITTSMNASGYEYIGTNDNTDFIFATNDRERMRILRDGQLVAYGKGIATPASSPTGCVPAYPVIDAASFYGTANTYPLNAYSENVPAVYGAASDVSGGFAADPCGVQGVINNYGFGTMGISLNATGGYSIGVYGEEVSLNGWAMICEGDGGITGAWYFVSDERLKEKVEPYQAGLRTVMQLKPKSYYFKQNYHDYGMPRSERIGFVAQEVEEVLPQLVKTSAIPGPPGPKGQPELKKPNLDGIHSIDYVGLVPILTSAIQEQQAVIEALQDENASMKQRLLALEEKLFTPPPYRKDE